MINPDFEEIYTFLNSIKEKFGSWDNVPKVIPISRRTIFYWKKNKQMSKNEMRLLQAMLKMRVRFIPEVGIYTKGKRWHPVEILIRLDKFKQKVGTWNEVADQLEMPRESLIRCKTTGRMSRTTALLLDRLLTAKGFSVDTQYLL